MRSLFEQQRDRPWIFLRNLGNFGDILLFKGAELLATRAGVSWNSFETPEFEQLEISDEHCIYLQGGGGFNEWSSGRAFTNLKVAARSRARIVVQGPMTAGGKSDWLQLRFAECLANTNCGDIKIFAREKYTHGLLKRIGLQECGADLMLDHDTALAFSAGDVLNLAGLPTMPEGRYDLIVAREDPEQPKKPIERRAGSLRRGSIIIDPAYEAVSFRHWLRIHLFARSIVTNRLHSSIIGRIADKPVTLGPGVYHKNRSVWEHSLKGQGPVWSAELPSVADNWSKLPERLRESYKLRRLRLLYHRVPLS